MRPLVAAALIAGLLACSGAATPEQAARAAKTDAAIEAALAKHFRPDFPEVAEWSSENGSVTFKVDVSKLPTGSDVSSEAKGLASGAAMIASEKTGTFATARALYRSGDLICSATANGAVIVRTHCM